MDCSCGREKCTCQKCICTHTEGCLCSSCCDFSKKCGLCGLKIPGIYFPGTNSTVDEEPDNCQCLVTEDHGVNISAQAQASADSEAVTGATSNIAPVISRSNPGISSASLMHPTHGRVASSSAGTERGNTEQENMSILREMLKNRGGSEGNEENVEKEGEMKAAEGIERPAQSDMSQREKTTSFSTLAITSDHSHQQQYESRGITTSAGYPVPAYQQFNQNIILSNFPGISPNSHQLRYGIPRMGTSRYIHPHTYVIPVLNPSTPNRMGLIINPSQRAAVHVIGQNYENPTLNLPEGSSVQQQQVELPFYSPYQNLRLVPPPPLGCIISPPALRVAYPSVSVPLEPRMRRRRHPYACGTRPSLPQSSSKEKVERWLKEQDSSSTEHRPVSSMSSDNREDSAERPVAEDNESDEENTTSSSPKTDN